MINEYSNSKYSYDLTPVRMWLCRVSGLVNTINELITKCRKSFWFVPTLTRSINGDSQIGKLIRNVIFINTCSQKFLIQFLRISRLFADLLKFKCSKKKIKRSVNYLLLSLCNIDVRKNASVKNAPPIPDGSDLHDLGQNTIDVSAAEYYLQPSRLTLHVRVLELCSAGGPPLWMI